MARIRDGDLWQWDTGRVIELLDSDNVDEIHYYNSGTNVAEMGVLEKDGDITISEIPPKFLTEPRDLVVFLTTISARGVRTIRRVRFGVKRRPKPPEYVEEDDTITYLLVDEEGNSVPAIMVEDVALFTATANDIRLGTVAATAEGVTEGTKVIPAYHTTEGYRLISSGSRFEILFDDDLYDFTKFQAVICPYSGSISASAAADKVSIDEKVYAVMSSDVVSDVIRDGENKCIDLGITNESDTRYLLRFFTHKEVI